MADEKVPPPEIVLVGPDGNKYPRAFVKAPGFPPNLGNGFKIELATFYQIVALLADASRRA